MLQYADIADVKDDVLRLCELSKKPIIKKNVSIQILYVADMDTFGFIPNERGWHQFHLK